jgi:hypothetical protein
LSRNLGRSKKEEGYIDAEMFLKIVEASLEFLKENAVVVEEFYYYY